jgi:transposase
MIENSMSWKAFHRCIGDKIHYQSVYQRFQKWVKYGVFQYIWKELLQQYASQKLANNPVHFMNLFTDTTMIKSLEGTDCVGRNPTDRGRNGTKVSVIIDENKVAISEPVMFPANTNDIHTLAPTLRSIPFVIRTDRRRTTRIAADKAYRKKSLATNLLMMKIRLVTEPKRGEVNPILMRSKDKAFYKKRIYIEHFFGMIKKGNKRIRCRVDRKVATYNAFWYLAMARKTFKALNH